MIRIVLADRAARDIEAIESFSAERWGRRTADEYLDSIQDALILLRTNAALLRARKDISPHFTFYRVRKHFLVCLLEEDVIYVLTVKHAEIDLPNRITELEPQLLLEAELLNSAFKNSRKEE